MIWSVVDVFRKITFLFPSYLMVCNIGYGWMMLNEYDHFSCDMIIGLCAGWMNRFAFVDCGSLASGERMRVSSGEMVGQILQSNWFPQSCPVFENFAPALAGHYLIWYLRIIVYIYICMYLFFYSSFYVFICLFIQYIKDDLGYLGVNVHVDVEKSFGISCLKWARRSPTSQCETKLFWLMRGDYTTQYRWL